MELVRYFMQAPADFPQYPRWIYWLAVICVCIGTELIKLPIKYFTKQLPEKRRMQINTVLIAIPEALGLIIGGILSSCGYAFSTMAAMSWGVASQLIYLFLKKVYTRLKGGESITLDTLNEDFKEAQEEMNSNDDDDDDEEEDDDEETADDKFVNICDEIKSFKQ